MKILPLDQKQRCQNCNLICDRQGQKRAHCTRYENSPAVSIARLEHKKTGPVFGRHWHEQLQLLLIKRGSVTIHCSGIPHELAAGDILIINSNEIHYGLSHQDSALYYIVKIDCKALFASQQLSQQSPQLAPLLENQLFFKNKIEKNQPLTTAIEAIIAEADGQQPGFELSIQAAVYQIIVELLRNCQQPLPAAKQSLRPAERFEQLRPALAYLDAHYSCNIQLDALASLANMSPQHFCRLFKNLTGRRPMEYVNFLRINKALLLLGDKRLNISEIAAAVGFSDSNYFSRIFKKYQQTSPTKIRQQIQNQLR